MYLDRMNLSQRLYPCRRFLFWSFWSDFSGQRNGSSLEQTIECWHVKLQRDKQIVWYKFYDTLKMLYNGSNSFVKLTKVTEGKS